MDMEGQLQDCKKPLNMTLSSVDSLESLKFKLKIKFWVPGGGGVEKIREPKNPWGPKIVGPKIFRKI